MYTPHRLLRQFGFDQEAVRVRGDVFTSITLVPEQQFGGFTIFM